MYLERNMGKKEDSIGLPSCFLMECGKTRNSVLGVRCFQLYITLWLLEVRNEPKQINKSIPLEYI
jgi:hypothetical protein